MSRNGYTREDALARINSQMRLDDKRSYADVIIDNNGTPQALTAKLDTIWSERLELLLQKNSIITIDVSKLVYKK